MEPDERGINEARSYACELVAWRFLAHLSESELIDYLLYDLPPPERSSRRSSLQLHHDHPSSTTDRSRDSLEHDENDGLLTGQSYVRHVQILDEPHEHDYFAPGTSSQSVKDAEEDPTLPFVGLNALEIAAVAEAKKFLSQRVVQRIVNGVFNGDIAFWQSLNTQTKRKAQVYNER